MLVDLTKRVVERLELAAKPYEVRDTIFRDFLVRVESGGAKTFFLVYRLAGGRKGKRKRYKLGRFPNLSCEGARALAKQIAGEVAAGRDPQARRQAERQQAERDRLSTLRAFLDDRYEPWAKTHLKSHRFQLKRIRSDFADHLGQPLSAFNPFMIEGMRQKWKKGGMAPRSINRDIQLQDFL